MLSLCLRARGPGLSARVIDTIVRIFSCFCCCTKDSAAFVFATILCVLRHTFAQLVHGLQLTPMIAAEPLCRRGVADKVLVHAVSAAGWNQQLRILRASGAVLQTRGAGESLRHSRGTLKAEGELLLHHGILKGKQ